MARKKNPTPRKSTASISNSKADALESNAKKTKTIATTAKSVTADGAAKTRKKVRFHPGTVALRDCRKMQKSVDLLLQRAPFERLVREIAQDYKNDLRFTATSLEALQTSSEVFLTELMESTEFLSALSNCATIQPWHFAGSAILTSQGNAHGVRVMERTTKGVPCLMANIGCDFLLRDSKSIINEEHRDEKQHPSVRGYKMALPRTRESANVSSSSKKAKAGANDQTRDDASDHATEFTFEQTAKNASESSALVNKKKSGAAAAAKLVKKTVPGKATIVPTKAGKAAKAAVAEIAPLSIAQEGDDNDENNDNDAVAHVDSPTIDSVAGDDAELGNDESADGDNAQPADADEDQAMDDASLSEQQHQSQEQQADQNAVVVVAEEDANNEPMASETSDEPVAASMPPLDDGNDAAPKKQVITKKASTVAEKKKKTADASQTKSTAAVSKNASSPGIMGAVRAFIGRGGAESGESNK